MVSFWNSISAVLLILMMIAVGYLFGRLGWMKSEHKPFVTKFLIYVAMPCMCIQNVFANFTPDILKSSGLLLLVPLVFNLCTMALSLGVAKLMRISRKRFGGFVVMCSMSNSLFVGYPVCMELFGDVGIPYMMCFYIVNTTMFWVLGAPLIYHSGESGQTFTLGGSLKRLVTSPPLVALAAAIAVLLLGIEPPHIINSFCKYMSNAVTPLALLYVGFLIYETGLKNLRPDAGIWVASGMRFVAAPIVMVLLCRLFRLDADVTAVFMIEAAMPMMTQSVVVSAFAGADEKYNALGMSVTSILCLLAIPLLMLLI